MIQRHAHDFFDSSRTSSSVALAGKREPCTGDCLQGAEVADLTLGKPCLFPLSTSATVAQALKALKYNKDIDVLSVWVESSSSEGGSAAEAQAGLLKNGGRARDRYRCGGMVTTSDIITFLATQENLLKPGAAMNTPLSVLYPSLSQAVEHVHPRTSLCQGLDAMLDGVQHLVVPITKKRKQGKPLKIPGPLSANGVPSGDYCWITQEDVVRYLLSSIGSFYPLPMMSLEELGMINTDVMMVDLSSPARSALPFLQRASQEMTAVAVVTGLAHGDRAEPLKVKKPKLVGDISTQTLRGCNESAATALATLSVKEFLQYIHDVGGPSQDLVETVASRLKQMALSRSGSTVGGSCPPLGKFKKSGPAKFSTSSSSSDGESDLSDGVSDYSSSDEDPLAGTSKEPPSLVLSKLNASRPSIEQHTRARTLISCRPHSSLVAVMAQALAHRINHVWVTDVEGGLVGIVTYTDMIDVLLSQLHYSD
ncbi:unnamed protein product [Calypogeia fissa]